MCRGSSLIDAALGVESRGSSTTPVPAPETSTSSWTGPVWGSFERNTGGWSPYSASENLRIERAFSESDAETIEVPTCFNAVVHFNRQGGHHHQLTPAVGTKPPGFRSVLRGQVDEMATLHWWPEPGLWRLEPPPADVPGPVHTQHVRIEPPADSADSFTWQWCDLLGRAVAEAREINWHPYAAEHGEEIEAAWAAGVERELVVGLTSYRVGGWQGSYGTQTNLTTGVIRQVRRGRFFVVSSVPADYVEESCALCTEMFTDTPQWPIRRTPCNHAFHWTCLQHILRQRGGQAAKCPMCRRSLGSMSAGDTGAAAQRGGGVGAAASQFDDSAMHHMADLAHHMNLR
jgi:hypothetical protein